jgi:ubiquinone/menaquinone biosynthesis C-methylase UbiE
MAPASYGAAAAAAWASGASLVYGPLADALVARSPDPLAGRRILDVGAGTGVGSASLQRAGATPIAVDFSADMLREARSRRPPSAAGDATALPVRSGSCDGAYAAFVLNHVTEPVVGLRELARVCRPGDPILCDVFSTESQHDGRDAVDAAAMRRGWVPPAWYASMKETAIPLLGSASAMRDAAVRAGLVDIEVEEVAVDVGVTDPADLVTYRFGQAHVQGFVNGLSPADRDALRAEAAAAAAEVMTPYRPLVVFLAARTPPSRR